MGSSLALRQEQNLKGKKKDSSSFLARAQSLKSHGLYAFYNPPNFVFPSIKCFCFVLFPHALQTLAYGSLWWQTLNCNSLLTPDKPIFCWGNIRLTISDQQKPIQQGSESFSSNKKNLKLQR